MSEPLSMETSFLMLLSKDVLGTCVEKLGKIVLKSILNGQRKNCHYLKEISSGFTFRWV